ncbi:MAG TPA: ATP-binding cassette domain-containing protein, partial [Gemmataceae bacterium]|nr:ATP-binding cassette domain-containing protein [Gemmataceae bacterium]
CARLDGMARAEARAATAQALKTVGMTEHMNRAIAGYSKGMRQRTKVAQALVHDPEVVFLDEPLNGTDPVARRDLVELIKYLGRCGKSVVVSSHVLHEVQAMTSTIVLLSRGRLVAEGNIHDIRELIDKHPHRIVLVCKEYRTLAARLLPFADVEGVQVQDNQRSITVETRLPDAFYGRLPQLAIDDSLGIEEVYSEDDNLEAVFKYLVKQ